MTDEMKLLRAFIEASGYEIEEVSATRDGQVIPDSVIYYKVTKKEDVKYTANNSPGLLGSRQEEARKGKGFVPPESFGQ